MSRRLVGFIAALLASCTVIAAQAPRPTGICPGDPAQFHACAVIQEKTFNPPRTADGKPDMQGTWRGQTSGVENIEAHAGNGDIGAGPSLIVDPADGRIPYQPWALAKVKENFEKYVDPNVPCFLSGVPRTLYTPQNFGIIQTPGYVIIAHERAHGYRIIPTGPSAKATERSAERPREGGRPDEGVHAEQNIRLWQGRSRGRWEGSTLVVDVRNQNGKTWLDQQGNFFSDRVHIIERFTLVDADTIHYEARIEDPDVYTRPWTMAFAIRRSQPKDYEVWEEACYEGERDTQLQVKLGLRIYPGLSGKPVR